jgi:hypothetical protein
LGREILAQKKTKSMWGNDEQDTEADSPAATGRRNNIRKASSDFPRTYSKQYLSQQKAGRPKSNRTGQENPERTKPKDERENGNTCADQESPCGGDTLIQNW